MKKTLFDVNPKLSAEWHPKLNGGLKPTEVSPNSIKKVWWLCSYGHQWKATISKRSYGTGCPFCSGRLPILGKTDFATLKPDIAKEWHPTLNKGLKPSQVSAYSNKRVWWLCSNGHEWESAIDKRSMGRGCPFCSGRLPLLGKTDFANLKPEIAAEWHPTRNKELKPSQVCLHSNKKVWWLCSNGHEWKVTINQRSNDTCCPFCSGRLPILGKTDFATLKPDIAKEWHPTLNKGLKPSQVTISSNKKVWWLCSNGHEWKSTINHRSYGTGCPFCSGRLPILGETDFATLKPDIAKEWHPTLNKGLKPSQVSIYSNKKVWWLCSNGHQWEATINNRSHGKGCPFCSGHLPILGKTDLATLKPEIAAEWHSTRNKGLKASQVCVNSHKTVYWKCKQGHEWQAKIYNRSNGTNCPFCSGCLSILDKTDLAFLKPDIAVEWHPTLNGELNPTEISPNSSKKVWWLCKNGHEWQAKIYSRSQGTGCPFCSGHLPILGKTDFATLKPEIAAEWHPTLNGKLNPTETCPSSSKKVWWLCKNGHEWQATINSRSNGTGCPKCSGYIPIPGISDLATLRPKIAAEWHPTLNKGLKASQVCLYSSKKVYWKCKQGHVWKAKIYNRTNGRGCPECSGKRYKSRQILYNN